MTRQAQESLGAAGGTVLGIVGLIGDHQGAGLRQGSRKPGPAVQLKPQAQGCRLLSPVGMETHRSDHQDAAIRQTHEGPGGHQGGEGLAQTHGIGEHRTTAGQQPAHGGPLMGQQNPPIRQKLSRSGRHHQLPMGRQGWQGLPQPGEPLLQLRRGRNAPSQLTLKDRRGLQRKLPAMAPGLPNTGGPNRTQLSLGHGVVGGDHLDQPGGAQPHRDRRRGQGAEKQRGLH